MPIENDNADNSDRILKLSTPLFFKISNSFLSFRQIKKNFVVIKKINGKSSNKTEGEFNKARKNGQ